MIEKTIDSDQPITTFDEDRFGRAQFASRIADVIVRRTDASSVVIGVTAPWGEGKTSVLNLISRRLELETALIMHFNPWRFSDEESLLRSFYLSLAEKLNVSIETGREKAGIKIRRLAPVAGLANLLGYDAEKGVTGIVSLLPEAKIEELRSRIVSSLSDKKTRITILMDDIDRLDVDEIQAVFRLIKLSASFPYTAYVVSFDEARVAEALGQKYGQSSDAGRKFLEKILQVSLPLPPASSQVLTTMTIDGINAALASAAIETDDNQEKRFSEFFAKAFRPRITSPRLVKRFTNAISFVLPILKGEVNPTDLIFLEAIKVFYPELYQAIRINGDHILNYTVGEEILGSRDEKLGSEIDTAITNALKTISESSKSGIELLLQDLFPGLSSLSSLSRPYISYADGDAVEQKRISTREYFWRYFSYGIQPHDVSDNEIAGFIATISSRDTRFVKDFLRNYLVENPSRIDTVINKLRLDEDNLDSLTAIQLVKGVSSLSDIFPNCHPDDRWVGGGTRHQIARLLMHLIHSLEEFERESLLVEIAESTPDTLFAYDFADMMRGFGEKIESTEKSWVVVCDGVERKVNQIVSKRIATLAESIPLEDFNFAWAQDLYIFWFYNNAKKLQSYLNDKLAEGSVPFLQALGGLTRFDITGSKGFSSYVHRQLPWFRMVDCLIDTRQAADKIKNEFPGVENEEESPDLRKRIASAFVKECRQHVLAQPGPSLTNLHELA